MVEVGAAAVLHDKGLNLAQVTKGISARDAQVDHDAHRRGKDQCQNDCVFNGSAEPWRFVVHGCVMAEIPGYVITSMTQRVRSS